MMHCQKQFGGEAQGLHVSFFFDMNIWSGRPLLRFHTQPTANVTVNSGRDGNHNRRYCFQRKLNVHSIPSPFFVYRHKIPWIVCSNPKPRKVCGDRAARSRSNREHELKDEDRRRENTGDGRFKTKTKTNKTVIQFSNQINPFFPVPLSSLSPPYPPPLPTILNSHNSQPPLTP